MNQENKDIVIPNYKGVAYVANCKLHKSNNFKIVTFKDPNCADAEPVWISFIIPKSKSLDKGDKIKFCGDLTISTYLAKDNTQKSSAKLTFKNKDAHIELLAKSKYRF